MPATSCVRSAACTTPTGGEVLAELVYVLPILVAANVGAAGRLLDVRPTPNRGPAAPQTRPAPRSPALRGAGHPPLPVDGDVALWIARCPPAPPPLTTAIFPRHGQPFADVGLAGPGSSRRNRPLVPVLTGLAG